MTTIVEKGECISCGVCIDACPVKAIIMKNGIAYIDKTKCNDCGFCIDDCPTGCITIRK